MERQLTRSTRHSGLGVVVALGLVFTGAAGAEAQVQTLPGSSCQASGSAQDLTYSGVLAANRGNSRRSAVCPIVRRNSTDPWSFIFVFVRDRHSTQDVSCVAQARDVSGTAGTGWSDTQSTAGEGDQTLIFAAPAVALPDYGPYTVVCSLPAMEEVNQPSYIASYVIVEP